MVGCCAFASAIKQKMEKILGEDELFQALCIKAFEEFLTHGVVGTMSVRVRKR